MSAKKKKKNKLKDKSIILIVLSCVFILGIIFGSIMLGKIIDSDNKNDNKEDSNIINDLPANFRVQE